MCDRDPIGRRAGVPALALLAALASPGLPAQDGGELRDPFRPHGWGQQSAPADDFDAGAWQLESTLTSNGRRVAVINGRPVRPGDRVGGARVLRIEPGAAYLDYDGREFTLRRPTTQVRRE